MTQKAHQISTTDGAPIEVDGGGALTAEYKGTCLSLPMSELFAEVAKRQRFK